MMVRLVRLGPADLDHELLWGSVTAASLFVAVTWLRWIGPPSLVCPFHWLTGIPCPTCGATRALAALVSGHVGLSIRLHPAGAPGALLLGLYLIFAIVVVAFRLPRIRLALDANEMAAARWSVLALGAAFWVVHIVTTG